MITFTAGILTAENALISYSIPDIASAEEAVLSDAGGLSVPFWRSAFIRGDASDGAISLWEDLAAVRLENPTGALIRLAGKHWVIRAVKLHTFTDYSDTLTVESEHYLMNRGLQISPVGTIFFLEDTQTDDAWILLSEAPDYVDSTLRIKDGAVTLDTAGNPLILGRCRVGECEALCRACYRHICKPKVPFAMSNTWGDRNGFSRVCDEFVRREMEAGQRLGVDIVQIDDGWQTGSTRDCGRDAQNRRIFADPFWELNEARFPAGMKSMTEYAAARGLKTGLWFAPDYHGSFALRARDKEVLRRAYAEWGIRFFKLDMFWIENEAEKEGMLDILSYIYSLGDDVAVQLDVTHGTRLGYYCGAQFGTLFVENRYTRSGNAFPHRVLRNLWNLGRFIPTTKFQFELINPTLNTEFYEADDPFAPARYSMDYLFAVTMLANPLFWMEMQFLPEEQCRRLAPLTDAWKAHRADFASADIVPIGECPGGRSLTGFRVRADEREYLLLFREVTDRSVMEIPAVSGRITVLASNTAAEAACSGGSLRVTLPDERAYAFIMID